MNKKLPSIKLDSMRMPAGMKSLLNVLEEGSTRVSTLGAIAGAGIDVVSATRDERAYLSDLAKEYRPEIAERLGVAESQVTEAHYHMAFAENPVLAQAKEVSQMQGGIRALNSTISLGVGMLAGLTVSAFTRRAQAGSTKGDASNIAGGVAATLGAAGAGKMVRKLLHVRKLDAALEQTAHHKIMKIKSKQQHGEETTAADIFAVQLALNPEIAQLISQQVGQDFGKMDAEQQTQLLKQEFPDVYQSNAEMARLINEEGLRPQKLVFGEIQPAEKPLPEPLAPGHPDLPPNAQGVGSQALEASGAEEAVAALRETPREQEKDGKPRSETPRHDMHREELPRAEQGEEARVKALQGLQEEEQEPMKFTQRLDAERRQPQENAQYR